MSLQTGFCQSCGAAVLWVRWQRTGRPMPLDPVEVPEGNVVLEADAPRYLHKDEQYDGPRYVSHFATCPQAPAWRLTRKD